MKVQIRYNVTLTGKVAINYNPRYKGHHFWGLNVSGIQNETGKSNHVEIVENLEIGFFSKSAIVLTNSDGLVSSFDSADSHA
mmetsp:Transcript_5140/g.7922  ORF Transcript_5140/g.7922 Transcript_5140/m.7922 type:complete len:82 (+) Transcript_5140:1943-2188(+)|eukprot:CAMPEP_0178938440 /NCGR_PEP_ID=MMETSP0786-20121207/26329_1 /TAXON_ID=186022 /ORGANISM="Thalassionema frauenfeldii, Strain CCMP 1798" /LENGTH=81 /DNA_ID=CAMNT_0020617153 /DNA_START=1327 /DNA_END=1572 /DNA_ORIENTATION=-